MSVIPLGPKYCENTRKYLDFYISNELLVETNHEVLKHLESCKECSEALQVRLRIKSRLREAAQRDIAPAALRERILKRVREDSSATKLATFSHHWSLVAAAVLVLLSGGWSLLHLWNLHDQPSLPAQASRLQSISEQTAAILRIGIGDHVHCVIDWHNDEKPITLEDMADKMGPDYFGLVSVVKDKLPPGYQIPVAHKCGFKGREFVHLILKDRQKVLSLIITRKQGVSFPPQDQAEGADSLGVSLRRARLQGFDVAGFETRDHLAFVVSSLDQEENLQIASELASPVNSFLTNLEL